MPAPLVIFGHKRHASMRRLLASLERNPEFRASPVHAFVDGPRTEAERADVEEVARVLAEVGHPDLTLVARPANLGLRQSVITGVGQVMDRHGAAIVLEDDLVLAPGALDYFNRALDRYAAVPAVGSITSHAFVSPRLDGRRSACFLPSPHPWGWATWRDRWQAADWSPAIDPALFRSPAFRSAFNAGGLRDYAQMLQLAEQGLVNSWFIYWCYDSHRRGRMTLYPPGPPFPQRRGELGRRHPCQPAEPL